MKKNQNATLITVVAAVAVAAVLAGAAVAARQGPSEAGTSGAGPLAGNATPSSSPTPSTTPSATPTPTSTKPVTAKKVKLDLDKLPQGRAPQLTYLRGRKVLGGAGQELTVPGKGEIVEVARLGNDILVILYNDAGRSELARFNYSEESGQRIPDVSSVVTDARATAGAYVISKYDKDGGLLKGGSITFENSEFGAITGRKLQRPDDYELRVLAVIDGVVYFQSQTDLENPLWHLYSWKPSETKATRLKTVSRPTALSENGKLAASIDTHADLAACSAVTEVATGRRNLRTCDYSISGFTPDSSVAYGGSAYQDGYADGISVALNTQTGNLITEWNGLSFRDTIAEDDQHLLMIVDDGPETNAAIIRCTIVGGACERATELSKANLIFGS